MCQYQEAIIDCNTTIRLCLHFIYIESQSRQNRQNRDISQPTCHNAWQHADIALEIQSSALSSFVIYTTLYRNLATQPGFSSEGSQL